MCATVPADFLVLRDLRSVGPERMSFFSVAGSACAPLMVFTGFYWNFSATVLDITCLGDRIQKTVSGMRRGVNSRMASAGVPEDGHGDRKNGFGDSPGERPSPNKSVIFLRRVYARFLRKAAENTRAAVRNSPSSAPWDACPAPAIAHPPSSLPPLLPPLPPPPLPAGL